MTPSDVKIVADNIDDFIEVPNGINRLRKAVLTLAVSGKLVPQDNKEGTADTLYDKVLSERYKSVGKKVDSLLPEIPKSAYPYEVPSSWKWVPLGNVTEFIYGDGLPKEQRNDSGKYFAYGANGPLGKTDLTNCNEGGIIVGRKGSAGAVTLVQEPFFATDVTYFIPERQFGAFDSKYLFHLLTALDLPKHAKGIKPGISRKEVYAMSIALPPLAEQKRIVEKVQSVMKKLDDLEVKKLTRDEVRTRLVCSAMQSLGKGEPKIAFEQLTELIKTPADIKEFENALLTLAISGKLVSQSKDDGTAEYLYNQIQEERAMTEKNSIARKRKVNNLPPIVADEIRFEIPRSWRWVRIGEISKVKGGKRLPKGSGFVEETTKHPYIRITDMKNGSVNTLGVPYISDEVFEKISRYTIRSEDVYVTIAGTIGDAGKIPKELDGANLTENAAKIEFKFLDMDFLVLALRSAPVKAQFLEKVVQMAQPKLALHRIESSIIPLPPLSEQKRIVKKVEEVMVLINRLKQMICNKNA